MVHLVTVALISLGFAGIDGSARLSVHVLAASGEPLAGATVFLCPGDAPRAVPAADCITRMTDASGAALYELPMSGTYFVVAQHEGFAHSAVYPLSFGPRAARLAPSTLEMCLNPVTIVDTVSFSARPTLGRRTLSPRSSPARRTPVADDSFALVR
jgi:hypothetical protein